MPKFWVKYNLFFRGGSEKVKYIEIDDEKDEDVITSLIQDHIATYWRGNYRGIEWDYIDHPPIEYIEKLLAIKQKDIVYINAEIKELEELKQKVKQNEMD